MNDLAPARPRASLDSQEAARLPALSSIPADLPDAIFRRRPPARTPAPPGPVAASPVAAPPLPATIGLARSTSTPRVPGLLRRGALVDKYQIEEVLGVGGFATVYRATHLLLRMPVALKLLRQDVLARRPASRGQLIDEARFTARITHPNVVRVYDASHSDELTYIVMEYIEGAPLSRRLAHGPVDIATTLRIGLEVAGALRAGLDQGIIHRDVKPANILIAPDGTSKLVDFGMASGSEDDLKPNGRRFVVGTRGYMSPEQAIDSRAIDFRADIYSLGVTLLEAATGRRPHPRSADRVPPPTTTTPARFLELVRWMQAASPQMRPHSYDELIEELRRLIEDLPPARRSA